MNVEMEISSYITSICQSINNLDPFEYKKMGKHSIINMIKNFYQVYISGKYRYVFIGSGSIGILYGKKKYILPPGKWRIGINDVIKIFNIGTYKYICDIGNTAKLHIFTTNIDIEKYIHFIYNLSDPEGYIKNKIETYLMFKRSIDILTIKRDINHIFDDLSITFDIEIIQQNKDDSVSSNISYAMKSMNTIDKSNSISYMSFPNIPIISSI